MQIKKQHNENSLPQSTTELKKLMKVVLEKAKKQGATDAAVTITQDQGFSVDVRMSDVESVTFGEDKELHLVIYHGLKKGNASSTDFEEHAINKMVNAACDIAKISEDDPCHGLAEKELHPVQDISLDLYHPWDMNPEKAIKLALECEHQALKKDSKITNSDGVSLSSYQSEYGYANTHGFEGWIKSTHHSLSCSLIGTDGKDMQRDYDYTTSRDPKWLLSTSALAESAVNRTIHRLSAKKLKTQKAPVIFSNRVSQGLFGSFISAISGGNLYRKSSFLLNALNSQVFPSFVDVFEQPHLPGALGSGYFDTDGVATRPNQIVTQGTLNQYVLGCYSARRLGLATTGNADGTHNLTIKPNAGELSELLDEMGTGLLITELMGQGVNIVTGDYSRGAYGFWVENGEIKFPVHEITIAGNLKDMFQNIAAIGSDMNPNLSTRCGSVLIREMMVAGS